MKKSSVVAVVVPLVVMGGLGVALADKLSDFKDAAGMDRCASIPYSDYRSMCESQQSPVHDWCDGGHGAVSCPGGKSGTRQIKEAVDKAQRALEAAKDAKRTADSNRSKSDLTDDQKRTAEGEYKKASDAVDHAEQALEQSKKDLDATGKLVSDAIYNIEKCLDYRRVVMNVFDSAQDRVRNESDPPEIVPYARQLGGKWEVSKSEHAETITAEENALAQCKDAVDPDSKKKSAPPLYTAVDAKISVGGVAGLSTKTEPQWVLLADANVTTLDTTSPTASFGIERDTQFTQLRVRLSKNLNASKVEAPAGNRAFARRLLAPATADFSTAAHVEWRPLAYVRCSPDCDALNRVVHTKLSGGFYAGFDVGETLFSAKQTDGSTLAVNSVPLAWSVGVVGRLEGALPKNANVLGSSSIAVTPYLGYTGRKLGGDLGKADRLHTIGVDTEYLNGVELGLGVQLGNVIFDPKLTLLSNRKDPDIDGLTGLQFQITATFILPWTVVGGDGSDKEQKIDAQTKKVMAEEQQKAAEEKQKKAEQQVQKLENELQRVQAAPTAPTK